MQSAVAAQPVPPSIGHGSVAVTTGETNKPAPNIVVVVVVVAAATAVAAVVIKARGRRLDFLIVVIQSSSWCSWLCAMKVCSGFGA